MAETHDFLALDWVKGEIEETLKQAQQALEAHVENPEDQTRLRFCLTYLHQVYGTLQMVEFYGAALLAEELKKLTQALLNGKVSRVADPQETLMRGMLQMPAYLDRIKASRRDMPVVLLPLLNDIRAARGEKLLSEGALFKPDMAQAVGAGMVSNAVAADPNLAELLRKIRQLFQLGLLGVIRGENAATNIGYMAKAAAKLEKVSGDAAVSPLWEVTGAVIEGIATDSIEASTAVKLLLGQVDRQIKLLVDRGAPAFADKPAPDLFKNLLFYVARSSAESPLIAQMRRAYKLDEALLSEDMIDEERAMLSGPDQQTLATVAGAISEELARVKEALDIFMRGGAQSKIADLGPHVVTLKQVSDTIAMLGLGQQRKLVQEQYERLEKIVREDKLENPGILLDVAGALLYVEVTLASGGDQSSSKVPATQQDALTQDEIAKAREAVVRECRAGLELTKEKIVEYIASQWERSHVQDVPETLTAVRGGLQMISLDRAGAVLTAAVAFVSKELLADQAKPDWQRMDTLADAISSVEYYLERVIKDPESGDHILKIAEQAVANLGYSVAALLAVPAVRVAVAQRVDVAGAEIAGFEPGSVELDKAAPVFLPTLTADFSEELEAEPTLDVPMTAAQENKHSFADEEVALVDEEALELLAPVHGLPAADNGAKESDIGTEVVEIFVEEVGVIMRKLDEYLPQWASNQQDKSSLAEFRRAFHTLKGSGRMVGAKYVGELAWSVENMLNRVIDKTITPTPVMVELIRTVKSVVPELVQAFATGREAPYVVEPLMECAAAFARGERPGDVPALVHRDAVVVAPAAFADDSFEEITLGEADIGALEAEFLALEETFSEEDVALLADAPSAESAEAPGIDSALMDVFSSESEQHIATLDEYLASIDPDVSRHPITDDLLRALHTLKGGARMAGIMAVADIAGPTEKFCKELRNNGEMADSDVIALVREATDLVRLRVRRLMPDPYAPIPGAQSYLEMLGAIQQSRHDAWAEAGAADVAGDAPTMAAVQPRPGVISELLAEGLDHVLDGSDYAVQWSQQSVVADDLDAMRLELARLTAAADRGGIAPMSAISTRLQRLYEGLHLGHLMLSSQAVGAAQQGHEAIIGMMDCMAAHQSVWPATEVEQALDAVLADLPTLALPQVPASAVADGANSADDFQFSEDDFAASEAEVMELTGTLEPMALSDDIESLSADDLLASEAEVLEADGTVEPIEYVAKAEAAVEEIALPREMAATRAAAVVAPATEPVAMAISGEELALGDDEIPDRDPELMEIFLEEAGEIVESSGESLETWLKNVDDLIEVEKLQRDLHTLKGGARMAEIPPLGDLAHELENLYEGLSQGTLTAQPALFELLNRCHDRMADMVDEIRKYGRCRKGKDLIAIIHAYIKDPENFTAEIPAVRLQPAVASATTTEPAAVAAVPEVPAIPQAVAAAPALVADAPDDDMAELDADILEIFLEEAEDLVAQLDVAITGWRGAPTHAGYPDELKRLLHTLKGGARLAGLRKLGDISHQFESHVIDLGPQVPGSEFFAEIHRYHDEIAAEVARIRSGGTTALVADVVAAPVVEIPAALVAPEPAAIEPVTAAITPAAPAPDHDDRQALAATAAVARQAQPQPQEMVKVPSDLLEKLVNLAGETSINRSRIEQQVTDFRFTISEMGSTISRLADQLRRLDAEADSQVKANWEKGVAEGKYSGEFDPLEMDQYSALHQLTKQLFESASDMLDIRDTLVNKTRDTETLLLQQSRVNTELQEGLMRSRMVPFSRLIPRLRRIVRQVAGELKKNIEVDFINPEGEMDRTLLERIVAPLEHMLRNACDHGVETPDVRVAAGKPAQGRIKLALTREGGEVVLTVSDDGKGINVNAVRKKAMERGLMDPTSELSDLEVMQFILEAGFSTAEKVTQISGRGVGMDVVSSEIKQMGGALMIRSEMGQGTSFEIRLPFTVSVNRALMVRVGEDQFAIPLVQIEGIMRVSPYELETYYGPDAPAFEYAGESYRLQYLGGFVHGVAAPDLRAATMPLPVLLVRGSEHAVAVQVDQLIGSREVVVKAVGPQLSNVAGISGATILGDGRVVIILDLLSLIRAAHLQHDMHLAQQRRTTLMSDTSPVASVREVPLIMVTDDSVTVRKVTGRFLERQGFEVVTAKDGVDAVAQLADIKPDLMLLDIEMPRMDGFEVASHCRHDSRLKDLPIIMITSRTGEKHRERAIEIGVNAYLGKPFQENELLAKIQELLAERRAQALH